MYFIVNRVIFDLGALKIISGKKFKRYSRPKPPHSYIATHA